MTDTPWQRRCNRVASRFRAVGGTLSVEGDSLVFQPTAIERRLDETDWSLPLAEVTGFRTSPVRPLDAFAGGLRPRLALDVRRPDGTVQTHLFVVRDPERVARELVTVAAEAKVLAGDDG